MVGSQDYQQFYFRGEKLTDIGELMKRKIATLPVDWSNGSVLDVGTDHGFWCFYAAENGADTALGLDRGRPVKGQQTDLACRNLKLARELGILNVFFDKIDLGKEWREYGRYENVLMLSCYHHVYHNCVDHSAIWFWLWNHTSVALWWEGPLSATDRVVQKDVQDKSQYNAERILAAANRYFIGERLGPSAIPGREVWRFVPRWIKPARYVGIATPGAGGASKAFAYADGRRIEEIFDALGFVPIPGSLNVTLSHPFDLNRHYYRVPILDVVDRSKGLESKWAPRWCRFYPVMVSGEGQSRFPAVAMRFEGERYSEKFIELVAERSLRRDLNFKDGDLVVVESW